MAEVKVDITAARSDVQRFTTNNNELKTEYGNLKNNVSSGISEFGIVYFSELEKYVNDMHLKNDRYQLGANQYLDALTKPSILTFLLANGFLYYLKYPMPYTPYYKRPVSSMPYTAHKKRYKYVPIVAKF